MKWHWTSRQFLLNGLWNSTILVRELQKWNSESGIIILPPIGFIQRDSWIQFTFFFCFFFILDFVRKLCWQSVLEKGNNEFDTTKTEPNLRSISEILPVLSISHIIILFSDHSDLSNYVWIASDSLRDGSTIRSEPLDAKYVVRMMFVVCMVQWCIQNKPYFHRGIYNCVFQARFVHRNGNNNHNSSKITID